MKFLSKYPPLSLLILLLTLILNSCSKGSGCQDCPLFGPTTPNPGGGLGHPPVAIAFYDSLSNQPVGSKLLTGKNSSDADGTIVSYEWKQIEGPSTAHITTAHSMETIVSNLFTGRYLFELKVIDNVGLSARDSVVVTL